MKLPPDQLATTVEVPVKRSRNAITLVPALLGLPWGTRTASCGAGWLTQCACRAAQAGTATGLGGALGEADGLGLSTGVGVGLAEGVGVCRTAEGLEAGARGPFAVQPAMAATDRRRTTPFLTGA